MLCYVLADLDSPFNRFFRVDLSVIPDVVRRAENMYELVRAGREADLSYPPDYLISATVRSGGRPTSPIL